METRNYLRNFALLAGAALLSTGALATPVLEPTVTESEIVKYSAPEAATPQGARMLYGKLQAAARRVCSGSVPASLIPHVDRVCAAEALSKAVADVDNPLLIALHRESQGGSWMAVKPALPAAGPETLASR
jgi:UrcA family protein